MKVAVIGLGPIGNMHATIYQSLPDAELAAVCDLRRDRAEAAGRKYGVPFYLDAGTMLREVRPELVSIATGGYEYSSDHYEPTLQALRAGAHVLCEKPICNDLRKAEEMVAVAEAEQRCFAIDFNHRFTPAARAAKNWQNQGRIGDLLFCNMNLWIGRDGPFETEFYHLKALNPHSVDMLRHFGGDIEEVSCFAMMAPGRDFYSTQSMNLRFACGAVGHITSSYDIKRGHPMERCEIAGTQGRMVIEDMWRQATLYPAETWIKEQYTNPVFGGYGQFYDTFADRLGTFVRQVAAGTRPEEIDGTGRDGLEASRVIHAAIRSIQAGGHPIRVEEVHD